jgi:4'-phosphopantetheinyl transferase
MATIHVVLREYTTLDATLINAMAPSPAERKRLNELHTRQTLGLALGALSESLRFGRTQHGKPYLSDSSIAFNISHTQTACAVAWSRDVTAVGVDIEDRNRRANMSGIARSNFSEQEQRRWNDAGHDALLWLAIWTRKEALLKCHGMGIRTRLSEVETGACLDRQVMRHSQLGEIAVYSTALTAQLLSLAWQPSGLDVQCLVDTAGAAVPLRPQSSIKKLRSCSDRDG